MASSGLAGLFAAVTKDGGYVSVAPGLYEVIYDLGYHDPHYNYQDVCKG
jgi:hypothetical protein